MVKFNIDIEYQNLSYLINYTENIPEVSGVYYWVYWPEYDIEKISYENAIKILEDYSLGTLSFPECFSKFKYKVEVSELGFPDNNNILGLSDSKSKLLLEHLKSDESLKYFLKIFKETCFLKPFYIGKAKNLRNRLKQHFNGYSEIIRQIDNSKISYNNIWVGYKIVEDNLNEEVSTIIEEIVQRIVKPGLTKRPG